MKMKYPRTYHLPFSPGASSDDKILDSAEHFEGKEVVVTIKMDGSNVSLYSFGFHGRSLDSKHEEYHSWLLKWLSTFQWQIPNDFRICGEYLYAKHSILYDELPTYFLGFSMWDKDICLDWDTTIEYFEELGVTPVPVLYRGIYNEELIKKLAIETVESGHEGIVVRMVNSFKYDDFKYNVTKYVRENHVQTDKHWKHQKIEINRLK